MSLIPLILVVVLLLTVIWIVLPAPNKHFWLLSVGVGEWGLWFGVAAVLCIASAVALRLFYGDGWLWLATSIIGGAAIAITFYPFFSVLPLARRNKIPLSFFRYFDGWPAKDFFAPYKTDFTTHSYASAGGVELLLDAYLPSVKNANNGVSVVVVHGGSWSGGTRSDFPRWNRWLCAQGFTVFDVDYRLAPQPNYLTATGDIKTAVRWIKNRATEFGVDPERVALLGRSAGAHLALLAAYSAGDERLPPTGDHSEPDSVRAAISIYGPTDMIWAYDKRGNPRVLDGPATLENFLGGAPDDSDEMRERYLLTSPIAYVNAATPPTLMTHGGRDLLVSWMNMYRLGEKLTEAGVTHEIYFIPYGQHGFDYNINGWGSQVVSAVLLKFLREHTQPVK